MIGRIANTVLRRSRQEVGPPRKVCPFCVEADHIGGRNHIPHITVEVCPRHHALLTEERLANGAEMKSQPHTLKSVEMALRSLAVTGYAIAGAVHKVSEGLDFCAEKLKAVREKRVQL